MIRKQIIIDEATRRRASALQEYYETSFSALIRRLIREECERWDIGVSYADKED